jgi:hypothetical protein
MRHTMGQDWGGRKRLNPENCAKITYKDVLEIAKQLSIEIKRGSYSRYDNNFIASKRGTWWIMKNDGDWMTIGDTNYLAYTWIMDNPEGNKVK